MRSSIVRTASPIQTASRATAPDCWGLTASDTIDGYTAHSPTNDRGVISPTAALSSFPYTPAESLAALRHFTTALGGRLWGEYGFKDAFSPAEGLVLGVLSRDRPGTDRRDDREPSQRPSLAALHELPGDRERPGKSRVFATAARVGLVPQAVAEVPGFARPKSIPVMRPSRRMRFARRHELALEARGRRRADRWRARRAARRRYIRRPTPGRYAPTTRRAPCEPMRTSGETVSRIGVW